MLEISLIRPISYGGVNGADLNFKPWGDLIRANSQDMLPVKDKDLERSYVDGLATVLLNSDNKIVGGTRFIPLLDSAKKQELNLSGLQLPDIWELGSIVVAKEAMGNGFSKDLNRTLLSSVKKKVQNGELLVIGTTKTAAILRMLWGLDLNDIGGEFSILPHIDLAMIAPLTCVCEKPLGTGFQMSPNCEYRVTPRQTEEIKQKERGFGLSPKIPCTLFVSDMALAKRTDDVLRQKYSMINPANPQEALVVALNRIGYYK